MVHCVERQVAGMASEDDAAEHIGVCGLVHLIR